MPVFTSADTRKLITQVKHGEGLRLEAYRCDKGALTIGYGHNCDAVPVPGVSKVGDRISAATAEALFEQDLSNAVWNVRRYWPWVEGLAVPRQAVLFDMAYNLGINGLRSFKRMRAALVDSNFTLAAAEMLDSRWAAQVKGRAVRLAHQMESGEWQV